MRVRSFGWIRPAARAWRAVRISAGAAPRAPAPGAVPPASDEARSNTRCGTAPATIFDDAELGHPANTGTSAACCSTSQTNPMHRLNTHGRARDHQQATTQALLEKWLTRRAERNQYQQRDIQRPLRPRPRRRVMPNSQPRTPSTPHARRSGRRVTDLRGNTRCWTSGMPTQAQVNRRRSAATGNGSMGQHGPS